MKVKIKTYNGSLVGYLSADKVYDVVEEWCSDLVSIVNDDGYYSTILLSDCSHLNGGSWEVVQC